MCSAKPLFSALMLLIIIMYMYGVVVLQFVTEELLHDGPNTETLLNYYSTLLHTISTLSMAISGGVDWRDVAIPLAEINIGLGILFGMYIAFAVLCVLNIVTGVFVDNATKTAQKDEDRLLMEDVDARKHWYSEVKRIFLEADSDNSGTLDWPKFERCVSDPRVQMLFRKVGVDMEAECPRGFFDLLDFAGEGKIDLDDFAMALQHLHGNARSIDLVRVRHDIKHFSRELANVMVWLQAPDQDLEPVTMALEPDHSTSTVNSNVNTLSDGLGPRRGGSISEDHAVDQPGMLQ